MDLNLNLFLKNLLFIDILNKDIPVSIGHQVFFLLWLSLLQ